MAITWALATGSKVWTGPISVSVAWSRRWVDPVGAWKGTNEDPGSGIEVGTPPGVAATTNPGASNPAEIALETSHRDIGTDIRTDVGTDIRTDVGTDIGEVIGTGSSAGVGTTEGSS